MGDNIVKGVYKSTDMDMRDFWLFFLEIPNTLVQNIYDCQSGSMENHLLFTCDLLKYRMTCCNHHYGVLPCQIIGPPKLLFQHISINSFQIISRNH